MVQAVVEMEEVVVVQVLQACEDKMIQKPLPILILTIIFLLSIIITPTQAKIFQENNTYYVEQEIEKEWNLIAGMSFSNFHESSEITADHILSAYYHDAQTQEIIDKRAQVPAPDNLPKISV